MKRFKYKAEAYLKFLNFEKEKSLREVKKAEARRQSLVEKFHWMESEMKKAYKLNESFGQGEISLQLINDNNTFIQLLKTNLLEVSNQIAIAEEEYQKKYNEFLDLQIKVKKMDLHKEIEHKKYLKERKKLLQKQTDEINSTRKRGVYAESL